MIAALAAPALAILVCLPFAVVWFVVWWAPRRDVLAVRHRAERPRTVLPARLTPSHRELPGRPSAARAARPLYVITDLPGHEARASEER